ncbi:hypothetical protein LGQ02_16150 [Bacillus shivajii]|uniref:hypothetical protein n=1 Tax=Bacillus shivajii TaxID=1983719 RepID=UPI001CFB24EE|nr:hypothetical protein [Bacillus shivajii]UCZ52361.1 hypothetical protein LGQ02_16150 [Bacillus shivajii]
MLLANINRSGQLLRYLLSGSFLFTTVFMTYWLNQVDVESYTYILLFVSIFFCLLSFFAAREKT